jgi:hypothetical protein
MSRGTHPLATCGFTLPLGPAAGVGPAADGEPVGDGVEPTPKRRRPRGPDLPEQHDVGGLEHVVHVRRVRQTLPAGGQDGPGVARDDLGEGLLVPAVPEAVE